MDRRLGPAFAALAAVLGVVAAVLITTGRQHRASQEDRAAHPILRPNEIKQPPQVALSQVRACLADAGLNPRPLGHGTLSLRGVSSGRDVLMVYPSTRAADTAYRSMDGERATWYGNNVVLHPGEGPSTIQGASGKVLRCAVSA
jgi:hypothetical protein